MKRIRKLVMVLAMGMVSSVLAESPVISDVIVRQRWPWSKLVDIEYVLTCDQSQEFDIVLEAFDGNEQLMLPLGSLTGDLYNIKRGYNRIVWDPIKCDFADNEVLPQFKVSLVTMVAPLYMIVDLTKGVGTEGQIEYVYEEDLTNNFWGAWQRNSITNEGVPIESVIWTDVASNDVYKTDKLVMRRIPAGTFTMGSPADEVGRDNDEHQHTVSLTKDFYIGVFEITQKQWNLMMGTWPSLISSSASRDTRPVECVTYYMIREDPTNVDDPAVDWPLNTAVNADSFMGILREKTGIYDFDLPTEAQWEYAYRAGTMNALYSGVNLTNEISDAELNPLGRYKCNGGMHWNDETSAWDIRPLLSSPATSNLTAKVGSYMPNAWGIYDMAGNVGEVCLDWYSADLGALPVIDPLGSVSATTSPVKRVSRGGAWTSNARLCRAAYRMACLPDDRNYNTGLRVVRRLP